MSTATKNVEKSDVEKRRIAYNLAETRLEGSPPGRVHRARQGGGVQVGRHLRAAQDRRGEGAGQDQGPARRVPRAGRQVQRLIGSMTMIWFIVIRMAVATAVAGVFGAAVATATWIITLCLAEFRCSAGSTIFHDRRSERRRQHHHRKGRS